MKDQKNFKVTEVGDGNLNLVFFADSEQISICIKQPLPYVRVLKDWPLTLKRSYFEYEYMKIHMPSINFQSLLSFPSILQLVIPFDLNFSKTCSDKDCICLEDVPLAIIM